LTYLQPIVSVILLMLGLGVLLRSRWVTGIGAAALLFVSWSPTVWLLSQPLEGWYSMEPPAGADVAAIVVLSGNVIQPQRSRPFPLAGHETYQRTMYAAWLHHELRGVPVVVCGGNPGPPHTESFAATMQRILVSAGVPGESIWLEERSRSTYENAVFSAQLLHAKQIRDVMLVTEAYHMPRAERCFRKQQLNVIPAPTGFRGFDPRLEEFVPAWSGIRHSELILHEAVGLLWYWLRGRI
jgi:uncharacterized SAM-binding protein YcdF (DUF218 family)